MAPRAAINICYISYRARIIYVVTSLLYIVSPLGAKDAFDLACNLIKNPWRVHCVRITTLTRCRGLPFGLSNLARMSPCLKYYSSGAINYCIIYTNI